MKGRKIMKEETYLSIFDEICREDEEDILRICSVASQKLNDLLKLPFDDPRLVGVIFSKTFDAILEELKSSEEKNSSAELNICNRFVIGYTTTASDEEEKSGNFMIYINHLSTENHYERSEDIHERDPKELCVKWNTDNINENPSAIQRIQAIAVDKLKQIDVLIGGKDIIMPVFVLTYESLVDVIKIRRSETKEFEYEVNFLSCFNITARETELGDSDISIRPNINAKLALKSDKLASSIYDD